MYECKNEQGDSDDKIQFSIVLKGVACFFPAMQAQYSTVWFLKPVLLALVLTNYVLIFLLFYLF